jgi:hypothetical protein
VTPETDLTGWYRMFRHIGFPPMKAAEKVVDKFARDIADLLVESPHWRRHLSSGERPYWAHVEHLRARYQLAKEWELQAEALAERQHARRMAELTATVRPILRSVK